MKLMHVNNATIMVKIALTLLVVPLHTAGVDVGFRTHVVAVDQDKENVRPFKVYSRRHFSGRD